MISQKEKTKYLVSDDKEIIDYILENDVECEVKGNRMWKEMEQAMEKRRTWQSLKNRYLKNIVPELHLPKYGLVAADIKKLKTGVKVNSQTKQQPIRLDDTSHGRLYTLEEDKQILEALLKTSLKFLSGNEIWKKMVKDEVCTGRTYQSMRNRFLKNIFPDLKNEAYGLSASDIETLNFNMKVYSTPESKEKSPKRNLPSNSIRKTWEKPSAKTPAHYYSLNINTSDEDTE